MFTGRIGLVTGAGSGIGAAIAKKLAEKDMHVVGCDIDANKLADTASCIGKLNAGAFTSIECDLRKEGDILNLFAKIREGSDLGRLHVCINCAGIGHKAPILTGETWMFREMFDVNVMAYVICAKESVKLMKECGVDDGHMLFINSMAGHQVRSGTEALTHFNFYNATKHALTAITEGIRNELKLMKTNIRVGQISPAIVETDFTYKMYPDEKDNVDELYQSTKCLTADNVAESVIYSLSQPPHVHVHDVFLKN